MTQQFTANEVRDWERAYKGTGAAKVFGAFADLLEAQERAVPVMVVNHVSSAEHDLPIGMKLYAHPSPSDALDAAIKQREQDAKYAARYRWLRDMRNREQAAMLVSFKMNLDAAIDTAMAKESPNG